MPGFSGGMICDFFHANMNLPSFQMRLYRMSSKVVISIGRWCSMSFVMVSGPGAVDFFRRLMEEVNSCCVNGLLILELLFFVGF